MTPAETPYEAGLGFCVRLNKGDFIGREALAKAKGQPPARKLCVVTFAGADAILYGGEAVYSHGQVVGRIRGAGYGYTVGKTIGYTYLPVELAAPGTAVQIDVLGEYVSAIVENDPLYDPEGKKLRA